MLRRLAHLIRRHLTPAGRRIAERLREIRYSR